MAVSSGWTLNFSPPSCNTIPAEEDCSIPLLLLKQFSLSPTVDFGSVVLGESSVKSLTAQNPTKSAIKIWTHEYHDKKGFTIQQPVLVQPESEIHFKIEWTPQELGSCRQIVPLRASSNLRLQIILLGQCRKQVQKQTLKRKTVLGKPIYERHLPKRQNYTDSSSPQRTRKLSEKENVTPEAIATHQGNKTPCKKILADQVFNIQDETYPLPSTPLRRQTFLVELPNDSPLMENYTWIIESKGHNSNSKLTTKTIWNLKSKNVSSQTDIHRMTFIHNKEPQIEEFNDSLEVLTHPDNNCQQRPELAPEYVSNTVLMGLNRLNQLFQNESPCEVFVQTEEKANETFLPSETSKIENVTLLEKYNSNVCEDTISNSTFAQNLESKKTENFFRCSTSSKFKTDPVDVVSERITKKSLDFNECGIGVEAAKGSLSLFIEISPTKASSVEKSQSVTGNCWNRPVGGKAANERKGEVKKLFRKKSIKKASSSRLAKQRPVFIKPAKSVVPHHPNPYASSNNYYDELWMEKEEHAFTQWINFTVRPFDGLSSTEDNTNVNALKLWNKNLLEKTVQKAPTKEELSLQQYKAVSEMNKLRGKACLLFQSPAMIQVVRQLEMEITLGRMSIKDESNPHADFGAKQAILNMLLSYTPLWLGIGLETVFGKVLSSTSGNVAVLSDFIVNQFLYSQSIAKQYAHPLVKNHFKEGYEKEIKKFILKKFLLLVLFLDTAKVNHLIEHDPCLFSRSASLKASKDIILKFCKDYMKGEGDILKHLRYFGYNVRWEQKPLEEFDFTITNLAVDLRSGIRLVRLVELLLKDWTLLPKVRISVPSRTQKIFNVHLALDALKTRGIQLPDRLDARDIVDGHRENTLQLLWLLVFKSSIENYLKSDLLIKEIGNLRRLLYVKGRTLKLQKELFPGPQLVQSRHSLEGLALLEDVCKVAHKSFLPDTELLLEWAQVVCSFDGIRVENLTVSFSDGRAFCAIIQHYRPTLLNLDDIQHETSHLLNKDGCAVQSDELMTRMKTFLENERSNLKLAFDMMGKLSDIPIVTRPEDLSNTIPDEKVIVTQLYYLCSRLISLKQDDWAARVVQSKWRYLVFRRKRSEFQAKAKYAVTIQRAVRAFLERKGIQGRNSAAVLLQATWRGYLTRRVLGKKELNRRNTSAILIQTHYRGYRTRKLLEQHYNAAVKIQACIRRFLAYKNFQKQICAVKKIQHCFRGYQLMFAQRKIFLETKAAVTVIERRLLMLKDRRQFLKTKAAAIVIQKNTRSFLERKKFLAVKTAAIVLQEWWRSHSLMQAERKMYLNFRQAIVFLQNKWRETKIRKDLLKSHIAAKIQALFRGYMKRKAFLNLKKSANSIKKWWRAILEGRKTRVSFLKIRSSIVHVQRVFRRKLEMKRRVKELAAVVIQKNWRSYQSRKSFLSLKDAVICIQQLWHAKTEASFQRKEFLRIQAAVLLLQKHTRRMLVRGYRTRKLLEQHYNAAVKIQACIRKFLVYKNFQKQICAVKKIQHCFRGYQLMLAQRKTFLETKAAVTVIERRLLLLKDRSQFLKTKAAAIVIQKNTRSFLERKKFLAVKRAAIVLQERWRSHSRMQAERKMFFNFRQAIILLQNKWRETKIRQDLLKSHIATKIQALFRGHRKRKAFLNLKKSAISIQKWWRAILEGRKTRVDFLKMRSSIVHVQRVFRRKLEINRQKKELAAVVIQKNWRSYQSRKSFLSLKDAVVCIQQLWHAKTEASFQRKEFLRIQAAVLLLQKNTRGMLVRKAITKQHLVTMIIQKNWRKHSIRKSYLTLVKSVHLIQSWWRSSRRAKQERDAYLKLKSASLVIQRCFRGSKVRLHKQHLSAIMIQKTWRMHSARQVYLNQVKSACTIQIYWRSFFSALNERNNFLELKVTTILIQSYTRGMIVRQKWQKELLAVEVIQKTWRQYSTKKKYLMLTKSVRLTQQLWRNKLKAKKEREQFLKVKASVKLIQRYIRGTSVRLQIQKQHIAAVVLQKIWRGRQASLNYFNLKLAVTLVQSTFRGMKCRKKLLIEKKSAIKIQAFIRMKQARIFYLRMKSAVRKIENIYLARMAERETQRALKERAAVIIQTHWRAYQKGTRNRKMYLRLREAAIVVQLRWKSRQSHLTFQELVRGRQSRIPLKLQLEQYRAATVIQAFWRGCQQRKTSTYSLQSISENLRALKDKATEDKRVASVINKTLNELLLDPTTIARLTGAVMTLDRIASIGTVFHQALLHSGVIPALYAVFYRGNRSPPFLLIYGYILKLFIKLAKCPLGSTHLWQEPKCLEFLEGFLKRHSKRDPQSTILFNQACNILWILAQESSRKMVCFLHQYWDFYSELQACDCSKEISSPYVYPVNCMSVALQQDERFCSFLLTKYNQLLNKQKSMSNIVKVKQNLDIDFSTVISSISTIVNWLEITYKAPYKNMKINM